MHGQQNIKFTVMCTQGATRDVILHTANPFKIWHPTQYTSSGRSIMSTKMFSLISWHLHDFFKYKNLFILTPFVLPYADKLTFSVAVRVFKFYPYSGSPFNPLKPELNPICYLLALLAHHFLHVSRIRVKSLTLR